MLKASTHHQNPKVSVIIPCYNLGQYLDEAVESVLAQTYQDFEIIIVNDGSTDEDSVNLLKNYTKPKTQVIHTPNQGVSAARNTGITASRGEYILPLDPDDRIGSTYLEKAVDILDRNDNIGIVYCEAELFGDKTGKWELPEYKFPDILLKNSILYAGFVRKLDWQRVNGYNPNMMYCWEDYDFWLSIIELGREVFRIPEILFFYRQRPNSRDKSITQEQFVDSYSQIFRNHLKLYSDNIGVLFHKLLNLTLSADHLREQLQEAQLQSILLSLNLRETNLIIFPNWHQSEELLRRELEQVIKAILKHPDKNHITLLIDTSNVPDNLELDANLVISGILMDLLIQEDLEIVDEPVISLVGKLGKSQWEGLLPYIHYRLAFESENQQAIAEVGAENIRICELSSLQQLRTFQLEEVLFSREMGNYFYQKDIYEEAVKHYQKFLEFLAGEAELYFILSECLRNLNRIEEAITTLQEGIRLYPTNGKLHFYLIKILQQNGLTQQAIAASETASHLLPNEYVFKLFKYLMLPIVYEYPDEISFYRQRFNDGLENLIQLCSEDRKDAVLGISSFTNFYLAYQAHNVLEAQCLYGNFVHEIMAANYPQWVQPLSMLPLKEQGKIRVGYMSAYLHSYSGTLWLTGWLRHCNRDKFEIYCYYTGNEPDAVTQFFQDYSDVFHHIPYNLEAACEQILTDQLHVLVFPEIGMDAQTMQTAALRLAPVQCVAWGHPVTSGLPTLDYFLSSELMEPDNAQEHYSETLIRLPNIGVAYPKPTDIPALTKTRPDFQLHEDNIVYLCCQAPFKYLPQHDFIFTEIARQLPQAKFVFLRGGLLKQRLSRAFQEVGLKSQDYCVFLTIPTRPDYLMINLLSDVFLDTLSWSGGNTSLEAIACNLPIVTCPGEFMRGRHSYSFLKMLGITDTIAQTQAEYIEIAVKLGLNPDWRRDIAERMNVRQAHLFDDKTCVEALEHFYQHVVNERLT